MTTLRSAAVLLPLMFATLAFADAPTLETILNGVTNVVGVIDKYSLPLDAAAAERSAVEAIVKIADPSARILSKSDIEHMMDERQGTDFCLGVRLTMTNGRPRILEVLPESPAVDAGLQAGDLIDRIGDRDVSRTDLPRACRLLRGRTNDALRIRYTRGLVPTNETTATLRALRVPAIETAEEFPNNIAYIRLNGLFKDSGHDIASVFRGWAAMGRFGAVLDLRGAVGDDLAAVTEVASLLAESGTPLYSFRDPASQDIDVVRANVGAPANMPVMVLVDERTSGAPEVLAAVLADSVRGAMLIGHETYGDPMIRVQVELPSGEILYLATRRLVTASGTVYGGRGGIVPDVKIEPKDGKDAADYEPDAGPDRRATLDEEIADKAVRERFRGDDTLKRAVDILIGLKALNIRGFPLSSDTTD
ncbi:MAG: S41 family peptidase [bacterium]